MHSASCVSVTATFTRRRCDGRAVVPACSRGARRGTRRSGSRVAIVGRRHVAARRVARLGDRAGCTVAPTSSTRGRSPGEVARRRRQRRQPSHRRRRCARSRSCVVGPLRYPARRGVAGVREIEQTIGGPSSVAERFRRVCVQSRRDRVPQGNVGGSGRRIRPDRVGQVAQCCRGQRCALDAGAQLALAAVSIRRHVSSACRGRRDIHSHSRSPSSSAWRAWRASARVSRVSASSK
jgi:hypothetical protein